MLMYGCTNTSFSVDKLQERYQALWSTVELARELPEFTVSIGHTEGHKTSLSIMFNSSNLINAGRQWTATCNNENLTVTEEYVDRDYQTILLVLDRDNISQTIRNCSLELNSAITKYFSLPALEIKNEDFSFVALSCSEPFSSAREGILARDIASWQRLGNRIKGEYSDGQLPYRPSFVLGLGDQIYVDPAPSAENTLALFGGSKSDNWYYQKDHSGRNSYAKAIQTVYRYNFSLPPIEEVFANIPAYLMWDDHEIRDGWGSHGDEKSKVWQSYFKDAKAAFWFNQYQRSINPNTDFEREVNTKLGKLDQAMEIQFSHGYNNHFYMIDSRSDKATSNELFSAHAAKKLSNWFNQGSSSEPNIYVLTIGVPLFHGRIGESILTKVADVFGVEINDDLKDAWSHPKNKESRLRIKNIIYEHFKDNSKDHLIILSGDVHYSTVSYLSIGDEVFGHEIVSSGIAHSLPSGARGANRLSSISKKESGISVTPVGIINRSASFAEISIGQHDGENTPDLKLVFHTNGALVTDEVEWVLANIHLLKHSSKDRYWYHDYDYSFVSRDEHLKSYNEFSSEYKGNTKAAGTIIKLHTDVLPSLNVSKNWLGNNMIDNNLQKGSTYCSVPKADYESTLAKSFDLSSELDLACVPFSLDNESK
jgi:hypothetical protein